MSAVALREAALRVLRLIERVGAFDDPVIPPERADDRPEVRALIRRAGAEGAVLLKNRGVLPLRPAAGSTIAVIGPNAATAQIMGGGSAQINPHYRVTPLDALRDALPSGVTVGYELGAVNQRIAALYESKVEAEFFDNKDFDGPARHRSTSGQGFFMFVGHETPGFSPMNYSARLRSNSSTKGIGGLSAQPDRVRPVAPVRQRKADGRRLGFPGRSRVLRGREQRSFGDHADGGRQGIRIRRRT